MKERIKKLGEKSLYVRIWTLKDKDSLFRAKNPDTHIVEIVAITSSSHCVIRDWQFDKAEQARQQFNYIIDLLK